MNTRLMKRWKETVLSSGFVALLFAHGIVGAMTEVEPNDTQAQAEVLSITSAGVSLSAMIGAAAGAMTTDLDIYSFEGKAGDVPNIMVNSDGNWDTFLVLFDAAGNILDMNDDAWPMNPDSNWATDSRIDSYRLNADGTYYIAVTPVPRYLGANFQVVFPDAASGGGYTLLVDGVTPTVVATPDPAPTPDPTPAPSSDVETVTIQVLPLVAEDREIGKFKGKDPLPVAIMSSPDFDAMSVDESTLTFGATGDERSLVRCKKKGKDVGVKDRQKDKVCYFRPDTAGFDNGDVQVFMKGATKQGKKFKATAALRTFSVSNKKDKTWQERHHKNPREKKPKKH